MTRWLLLCVALGYATPTHADAVPRATREVRVDEKVGARLPGELIFFTPDGTPQQLARSVRGDKPTLMMFAYARCRSLCSVVLQSATELIGQMDLKLGRDYRALLVGLDSAQSLEEARRHQDTLLARVGAAGHPERFPYLLGKPAQVEALADAVGFRYAWDERTEQYAHPAVFMIIDRNGRVTQYLHALGTRPDELADALRAADGSGDSAREVHGLAGDLLRCFQFDPALRRHRDAIARYFRVGGVVIFALLASLVLGLFAWERRQRT